MRVGFRVNRPGRLGRGAYFWRLDVYGKELAICWFRFWRGKGNYSGDRAVRGVIVTAQLSCSEDEYLDLDMDELRDEIGRELRRWPRHPQSSAAIGEFYDFYISKLEEQAGAKFVIIAGKVPLPKGHQYPVALGLPRCYCARTSSSISDLRLEEIVE